jgi:hypothetical protein
MRTLFIFSLLLLSACELVQATDKAATATAKAIAIAQTDAPILTKVEADFCAAQETANAVTDYYRLRGDVSAVAWFAGVSKVAGEGCKW